MGTWPFVQRGPSLGSRAQSFQTGASLALLLAVLCRSPCLCPQVLKNKPISSAQAERHFPESPSSLTWLSLGCQP